MDSAKSAKGFTKSPTTRLMNAEQALACVERALMELGKDPNPPPDGGGSAGRLSSDISPKGGRKEKNNGTSTVGLV